MRPLPLFLALVLAGSAAAGEPADTRVGVPVRLVQLSDKTWRFGVPVMIDGRPVEAGLDTGSTGLRVMARALPGSHGGGAPVHYGYGSGTQLDGPVVTAGVAFGALAAPIRLQRVDGLSCLRDHPRCPVTHNADTAAFGIQGNGLSGQGFAAILGANLHSAGAPNPFEALRVRRWIVELPRPGGGPGRIVLNPSDGDLAGFVRYRLLDDDNSLTACLSGPPPLGHVCGPATLDSGAPGLRVVGPDRHRAVPAETPIALTLGDGVAQASTRLVTERREQASHLEFERKQDAKATRLFLGVAPYWRWSVLYDADAHAIGLKPRQE